MFLFKGSLKQRYSSVGCFKTLWQQFKKKKLSLQYKNKLSPESLMEVCKLSLSPLYYCSIAVLLQT